MSLSRRMTLVGGLAAGASARINRASAQQVQIPQIAARVVRNGWGVCGNLGVDAPVEAYAAMLSQLRTRDLRMVLFSFGSSAAPRFQALYRLMQAQKLSAPLPKLTALVTAYLHDANTTWAMQQRALLEFAPTGMLRAIEGPNEISGRLPGGVGSHGPDDVIDHTNVPDFAANHLAWSKAIGQFKREHAGLLGNVSTVAPSLFVGPPATIQLVKDVSSFVDAGNLHYYSGRGRQPSLSMRFNPGVGSFENMLHWTRKAQMGTGPVWLTECGATTSNGHYARDGVTQAKYLANQLFDYFAANGQRMFIYQALDGSGRPNDVEGNFGLFFRDHPPAPKPAAILLAGLQEILSLGSYDDPRNLVDTAPIRRTFDPNALAIPGLTGSGADDPSCLVMPKADGSVLVAVWNEPPIDDGKGHALTPADHSVTVEFGSVQRYVVHDLMDPDLQAGLPVRRGRPSVGRAAEVVLRGYPVLIEILAR